jgi:serine/threonine-protein kinase HipA
MENNTAIVKGWGTTIGAVTWLPEEAHAVFEFDPQWVRLGIELAPLQMPLTQAHKPFSFPLHRLKRPFSLDDNQGFAGLPGLLSDSLPDRFGLFMIGQNHKINLLLNQIKNPVDLLRYIGNRGMGALTYHKPMDIGSSKPTDLDLADLHLEIRNLLRQNDPTAKIGITLLDKVTTILTSAGGARAKALIAVNNQTKEVRPHDAVLEGGFEHWIIKFDGITDQRFGQPLGATRLEIAIADMAHTIGIDVAECKLIQTGPTGSLAHFMTKRFDRHGHDRRLHFQSLNAMRHLSFGDQPTFWHSGEELLDVARRLGLGAAAKQQLFLRLAFNVAIQNLDDHTKNVGFLLDTITNPDQPVWKLAPAFDLTFIPINQQVIGGASHVLSINGKRSGITKSDLAALAEEADVNKWEPLLNNMLEVIADAKAFLIKRQVPTGLTNQALEAWGIVRQRLI